MPKLRYWSDRITLAQQRDVDGKIRELGKQLQRRTGDFSALDLFNADIFAYGVFLDLDLTDEEIVALIQERLQILTRMSKEFTAIQSENGFHYMFSEK
ncbi:hypothetical protein A0126_18835 (plasmid) [Exiguobacterium sp. N4-1P]|uniref:hypothetical protein n=1 Tax=Exiguobacterium sp. N4-1P TaxID=2051906 RepID=UPI000B58EE2B|nr:hypothetical protein [Exiguobacterium sp. N4-1P]ASI36872.1 hypothetical protein A0126_15155 [Exiguobacterium sp. N4-1P]ASI37645.1 hypothetical protein A0126_18835 [Exiguobacterium sp. N4-1P]